MFRYLSKSILLLLIQCNHPLCDLSVCSLGDRSGFLPVSGRTGSLLDRVRTAVW